MKKVIFFIFIIVTLTFIHSNTFANSGRIAYIILKSKELLYCELLTVRDSLLIVSTNFFLDDREIISQTDSLYILKCNQIDFIKLTEQKAPLRNRWLFALIGLGAGAGVAITDYERNNSLKATSYLALPIGLILGYLVGAYFDVPNYKPEEIIFPVCNVNLEKMLIQHCRYATAEPPRFKSRLNKILAAEYNK